MTTPEPIRPAEPAAAPPAPEGRPAGPDQPADQPAGRPRRRLALSPSRAKDFRQCPLMFRLRVVDALPEPPSAAALRGTLVHAALERLYDLPVADRTPPAAVGLVDAQWPALRERQADIAALFADERAEEEWLGSARVLVERYFAMENPRRLEPAGRERLVETELGSGVLLRGVIDRVDVAPNGAVRVVDYKTGRSPAPRFADEALFQLRFYALMLWRLTGSAPARLQILYLGDGRTLTHDPVEADLGATETEIDALWRGIEAAARAADFRPRPGPLCPWCSFQSLCPAKGGVAPLAPVEGIERLLAVRSGAAG